MRAFTIAAVCLGLAVPAVAQPQLPETDMQFTPPDIQVEGFGRVDLSAMSINLVALEGEAVYSAATNDRIGEVDDVYADSTGQNHLLGLEIGGFLEIGDKEMVVPLDEVAVYRRLPIEPDTTMDGGMAERDATVALPTHRVEDYRVYIDATEDELDDYPEFDLY